jgi:hypothetical protein
VFFLPFFCSPLVYPAVHLFVLSALNLGTFAFVKGMLYISRNEIRSTEINHYSVIFYINILFFTFCFLVKQLSFIRDNFIWSVPVFLLPDTLFGKHRFLFNPCTYVTGFSVFLVTELRGGWYKCVTSHRVL